MTLNEAISMPNRFKGIFDFKYDDALLLKPLSRLRVLQGKLLGRSEY
jgi:hypothetical protein